jgi:hypothetical protein
LIFLLPLLFLIIMGEQGLGVNPLLVVMISLALCFAAGAFMGTGREEDDSEDQPDKNRPSDDRISLARERTPTIPSGERVERR